MFTASLVGGTYSTVMVEANGYVREPMQTKRIAYNLDMQTIVQYGTPYMVWSGYFAFDNTTEMEKLRALSAARKFLFTDTTQGGRTGVLVFWAGDFFPEFDTDDLTSGRVKFRLESAGTI